MLPPLFSIARLPDIRVLAEWDLGDAKAFGTAN